MAVHVDQDDCLDRSSMKPRNLRQVESNERCCSPSRKGDQRSAIIIDHIEGNVFYLCG